MITAILLCGGKGSRMKESVPKQYLPLGDKPIILHALEALASFPDWQEIIIVCDPSYQALFTPYSHLPIKFALPGKERQYSLFSALDSLSPATKWVCIHDGARPLLQKKELFDVIECGKKYGAATLATPITSTVKEANNDLFVVKTLERERLWTIQTPQVIEVDLLKQGRALAEEKGLTLTDDVSLVELLHHKVKLVLGSVNNIKITTQEDLAIARFITGSHHV